MLLSFLGGMAKRGMQLNDERRAIDQQVELTRKLEGIKDEFAQRRASRAAASRAKANAKKYMGMLMPLVGGDEELARKYLINIKKEQEILLQWYIFTGNGYSIYKRWYFKSYC